MKTPSTRWILIPLLIAALVSIGIFVFSEISHARLYRASEYMTRSMQLQEVTRDVLGLVTEAETGQRGYLLTGRREYLEPYSNAVAKVDERLQQLRELAQGSSEEQMSHVANINNLIGKRMNEIEVSLALFRQDGMDAARTLLDTDIGRRNMDAVRAEIRAFNTTENANAGALWTLWERDIQYSRFGMTIIIALNLLLLMGIYGLALRESRRREQARREQLRYQEKLEATVRGRTVELSRAYRHLQAVQEAEKSKLARDIHDELGSILVSAKMDASWVQQHLPDAPALMEKQSRLLSMLDEGVQIKRRLIEELRPTLLDNLGLCAALEWQTTEVCRRAQLTYHLQLPEEEPTLSSEATIGLFRIVQEALTNIVRYAKAKNVWIDLSAQPDEVSLRVRDDGIGIPEKAAHTLSHGLLGMRERVIALKGEFNIETAPGRGTSIVVRVPTAPPVAPVAPPALAAAPAA